MPINIAMDGPVGAGKSTIADKVSQRLGILHLDTGAMYRACAIGVLRAGLDPQNEIETSECCESLQIDVGYEDGTQRTLLCGEDVTSELRTPEVSAAASAVAKWQRVRQKMVRAQQELARHHDMLIDGRDIGTRVLPDAPVKIYLTASAEERARRRWLQLEEQGQHLPYEQVLADLIARDRQDMGRKVDPLRVAENAVVVDSTNLTQEETVTKILEIVEAQYGRRD